MTESPTSWARPTSWPRRASWWSTSPRASPRTTSWPGCGGSCGTRKVGHAGTLDPMATGVLVCGVGRGTKLLGHLALDGKAYTATIRLGAATTTDDAEGEVVATADAADVADERGRRRASPR